MLLPYSKSVNNRVLNLLFIFMFFIQYLGVGFYAHIILLLIIMGMIFTRQVNTFSRNDLFLFCAVASIFLIKLINIPLICDVLLLKFYWGFILSYIFFKGLGYSMDYKKIFILTCIVTVVEFILINTIIPIGMMRNVPGGLSNISAHEDWGGYYRCYGLGSAPTVSATILIVLLSAIYTYQPHLYKDKYILYILPPLIMLGSGAGFFLFLLFLIIRYKLYKSKKIIFTFCIIIVSLFVIDSVLSQSRSLLSKFSIKYLEFLWWFKIEQITDVINVINNSIFQLLFGYSYTTRELLRTMSDFGWLDFLECYGFSGLLLFWWYVLAKKKFLIFPIFILMIGAFHYPALCSIPGQILLGSLLAIPNLALHNQNDKTENNNF